jgi:tetratricopeptide (TPR) repeat protein
MKNRILFSFLSFVYFLLSGCGHSKSGSPDNEVLRQPGLAALTDSIQIQPGNDMLYFRRAVLLNKNNYPEAALHDFQKAWSIRKEEFYALGIARLWMDKNPDSAVVFILDALRSIPGSILLRLQLARSYDALGKTGEALDACNQVLREDAKQVDVLKFKASLLDKKDSTGAALKTLEEAFTLSPNDAELNYELAERYADNKDPKTLRFCDAMIKKDSLHALPEPYYYKGIYYSNLKNWTEALAAFNMAIEKNYHYMRAYTEKGRVMMEEHKIPEAVKVFQLAITVDPSYPDTYFWMGKCQESLGQKDEAKLNYQRAYSLDKTFTQARDAADSLK